MAGDALAALAVGRVLRMELERASGTRLHHTVMAFQTDRIAGLAQVGGVLRPVHIVAGEAAHALQVHLTLNEVVALHAVLVGRTVRPVGERLLAETMLFQVPEIAQPIAGLVADRPVVVPPFDRVATRPSL